MQEELKAGDGGGAAACQLGGVVAMRPRNRFKRWGVGALQP